MTKRASFHRTATHHIDTSWGRAASGPTSIRIPQNTHTSERSRLSTTMACSILDDLAAFCANYRTPTMDSCFFGDCVYTLESLHMLIRCPGI